MAKFNGNISGTEFKQKDVGQLKPVRQYYQNITLDDIEATAVNSDKLDKNEG
jgi:hypothetical protein